MHMHELVHADSHMPRVLDVVAVCLWGHDAGAHSRWWSVHFTGTGTAARLAHGIAEYVSYYVRWCSAEEIAELWRFLTCETSPCRGLV